MTKTIERDTKTVRIDVVCPKCNSPMFYSCDIGDGEAMLGHIHECEKCSHEETLNDIYPQYKTVIIDNE